MDQKTIEEIYISWNKWVLNRVKDWERSMVNVDMCKRFELGSHQVTVKGCV